MSLPMRVPPGSTVSITSRPMARRRSASRCIWVVLPEPSGPSKVMKRLPWARSVVDIVEGGFQIFPCLSLGVLIVGPQEVGRMVGDHHWNVAPLVPFASQAGDAVFGFEEVFGGGGTEGADGFRMDDFELASEELSADFHFVRFGCAVFRRAAFDYVADVDVLAEERDAFLGGGAFDHLREELTGSADEGNSLGVLVGSGTFSYEDQFGLLVAYSEDDFVSGIAETAAVAVADVVDDFEERVCFGGRRGNCDGWLGHGDGGRILPV